MHGATIREIVQRPLFVREGENQKNIYNSENIGKARLFYF